MLRWNSVLDGLQSEVRSISQENYKPLAQARIADSYWYIDRVRSQALFIEALLLATSLDSKYTDKEIVIKSVLSIAGNRDSSLGRALTEKLMSDYQSENKTNPLLFENYSRLLNSTTPKGWEKGGFDFAAKLIFQLAQHSAPAADGVYFNYLNHVASSPTIPLEQLLRLAGYAFGYVEAYGFETGDGEMLLNSVLPSISISPNPTRILQLPIWESHIDVYERLLMSRRLCFKKKRPMVWRCFQYVT